MNTKTSKKEKHHLGNKTQTKAYDRYLQSKGVVKIHRSKAPMGTAHISYLIYIHLSQEGGEFSIDIL